MLLRQELEEREYELLDARASKALASAGREVTEEKCDFRTDYQRDRDRIIHSKAFRRLMHKTQVFLAPEGDHYRTRLTHTLEVAQVARTIARILNYNEDLTEAIALGHDLGHTPFGHNGEDVLNRIHEGGFRHNEQSLRTVERLECTAKRIGLNLTKEVRDGILNHRGAVIPITLEGQIVKISDRIAYINHDIDDAIRSNVISAADLPAEDLDILGHSHSMRINNLITDLARTSDGEDVIKLSPDYNDALLHLRKYMFNNVYCSELVKKEEDMNKVEVVITALYDYFVQHPAKMPELYREVASEDGTRIAVKDYVAGMTDRYAISLYSELFVPRGWTDFK
ncbi:deoxyguanosinetriphosphate triphosphohydrolase [Mogibacterium timidum]|uniref:deoxyguanosinetriphosphate triphosphohydrolase n=1 Tax=Mogibacterium timidum TaxID=35519 RepID=UPI0023520898|nr:deoxyguanosinetriphosphate triphosphohydrolase [Mogibacterium timidum]